MIESLKCATLYKVDIKRSLRRHIANINSPSLWLFIFVHPFLSCSASPFFRRFLNLDGMTCPLNAGESSCLRILLCPLKPVGTWRSSNHSLSLDCDRCCLCGRWWHPPSPAFSNATRYEGIIWWPVQLEALSWLCYCPKGAVRQKSQVATCTGKAGVARLASSLMLFDFLHLAEGAQSHGRTLLASH